MDVMTWIALISLIIAFASGYGQQKLSEGSAEIRGQINNLAKDIYSKIQENSNLKEKLMTLWNDKNQKAINALFQGMGYGARIEVIKKQIQQDKNEYLAKADELNKKGRVYEQHYNALQNAASNTGTLQGNKFAADTLREVKRSYDDNLDQNIKGGLDNA